MVTDGAVDIAGRPGALNVQTHRVFSERLNKAPRNEHVGT